MSGAAISSTTARLTSLPQNSVNHRMTTALLASSWLIGTTLLICFADPNRGCRVRGGRIARETGEAHSGSCRESISIGGVRLHGSPRKYWSRYDDHYIETLAAALRGIPVAEAIWCVFDNTASGAAIDNAWRLREQLRAV
ncbi:MAG: DUF72 domain-containing protein [Vicinamibacterales bacterium]